MKRFLQLNPDNRPAEWDDIKFWRDIHEIAPVDTSFGVFDSDERSDARMAGSIKHFETLPTLTADNKLVWKKADNSKIALTKTELEQVYDEIQTKRASRGAILHIKAEQFLQTSPIPDKSFLKILDNWLTE